MLIAKLYPSGLVTASYATKNPLSKLIDDAPSYSLTYEQQFQLKQVQEFGINEAIRAKKQADIEQEQATPLYLTNLSKTVTEDEELEFEYFYSVEADRARRGSKGITSKGRRMVKDACAMIEREYKLSRIAFITLTLPKPYAAIGGKDWSKAARSIKRKILRRLSEAGLPDDFVMVTEIQEKRGIKYGDYAHHLHIVYVGRHLGETWAIHTNELRRMWQETCEAVAGNMGDASWSACIYSRRIETTLVGYVGKYMSKGCKSVKRIIETNPDYEFPPSWYSVTNNLKKKVRKAVQVVSGEAAQDFMEWLQCHSDVLLKFQKKVEIKGVDGRDITVGWYGQVSDYETVSTMIFNCVNGIVYDVADKVHEYLEKVA